MRQHVEEALFPKLIAVCMICILPKACSASPRSIFARVLGAPHIARSSVSPVKNSGSFPKSNSRNCCAGIGVPSGCQELVIILCWMIH